MKFGQCRKYSLPQARFFIAVTVSLVIAVPTPASVPKYISLSVGGVYSIRVLPDFETERLVYEFRWEGIPAAKAEWTARCRRINGKTVLEVSGKAKTVKPLHLFWKMQGSIEAVVETNPILPRYFLLRKRENSRRRDTALNFDHQSRVIKIIRIGKRGRPRKYTRAIIGQYDPVSAAFALRALSLREGETVQMGVQSGKSVYHFDIRVLGREQITIKAGTFKAIVLAPSIYDLTGNESCTDLERAKIWVSDDRQRIVLKVESQVFAGLVRGELVAWQRY